ncbi:MAG: peptidyl-prolyl cis-trans isomerase [Candidatus Abyssobacteria bacterium SURF_17]|uniref:peptidylprolyl isomerase n=1 Tax=Candidatus Abyssobacteria bacterium SURF_17 TaxID=2093361 RepID=A0A419EZE3_9BACT|nr:MAG: peptidyl-prolyl cis-trans isomerase [Candidatus Abyssubacteria bacterium SURF_17]
MKSAICLLCLLILLTLWGCGLIIEEGREVLAEVGGDPIRLNDLMLRIRELPFEQRARTNDPNDSTRLQARRAVLQAMVVEHLLEREAVARGIVVPDEEVEALLEEREEQNTATNGVKETVPDATTGHAHTHHGGEGHSRQEIEKTRRRLLIDKLLKQQLSEDALRKYYDEHPELFRFSPPLVSCELLVVDSSDKRALDQVHRKTKEEGMTLGAALASLKDKPRIIFAGVTPPASLAQIAPSMREKIEMIEVGQVSDPFFLHAEGKDQYAVARLVDRIEKAPFENVAQQIQGRLYDEFIDALKQRYTVVYHEDKLNYRVGH